MTSSADSDGAKKLNDLFGGGDWDGAAQLRCYSTQLPNPNSDLGFKMVLWWF